MPVQTFRSSNQTPISNIEIDNLVFTQKPKTMSNYEFARQHGFLFKSSNNTNKAKAKYNTLSKETIKMRSDYLKQRFDCETWKRSKMRDRMYRLKMFTIKQETYTNRDGEQSVRTLYPAFNSYEIEESLNNKRKQYEESGDPAYLHDWSCSITNGCSEEELRETILDLRTAEQNYPEQKKRRSGVYYTTPDSEGFIKKIVIRRSNKRKPKNQGSTYPPPGSIKFRDTWIVPVEPNSVDTIGDS